MGSHPRDQGPDPHRLEIDGVVPVELWDLEVSGGILGDLIHDANFASTLSSALVHLREGTAATASGSDLTPCRGIARVLLAGGSIPTHTIACDGIVIDRAPGDARFLGVEGGLVALRARGHHRPLAVDVGQSALKLGLDGERRLVPRDVARLPVAGGDVPEGRRELRDFVSRGLHAIVTDRALPDAVVIALPAAVQEDGTPSGCTYVGLEGDRDFASDTLALAAMAGVPLYVMNDAEMAGAGLVLGYRPKVKTLLLTLGFGIGAAVLLSS